MNFYCILQFFLYSSTWKFYFVLLFSKHLWSVLYSILNILALTLFNFDERTIFTCGLTSKKSHLVTEVPICQAARRWRALNAAVAHCFYFWNNFGDDDSEIIMEQRKWYIFKLKSKVILLRQGKISIYIAQWNKDI